MHALPRKIRDLTKDLIDAGFVEKDVREQIEKVRRAGY
jgi:hypothetical protein